MSETSHLSQKNIFRWKDNHYQKIYQFFLFSITCNIFNSVEIYVQIKYDKWVVCSNKYIHKY